MDASPAVRGECPWRKNIVLNAQCPASSTRLSAVIRHRITSLKIKVVRQEKQVIRRSHRSEQTLAEKNLKITITNIFRNTEKKDRAFHQRGGIYKKGSKGNFSADTYNTLK